MKKKLEAELISIAHRILKLKNRAELDQLQQETLKLYEKISVLRFVEDNFSDVKPTIGHASAEEALEEIYGLEEQPEVHGNEQEAKEEAARDEKKNNPAAKGVEEAEKEVAPAQDKENESGEGVTAGKEEAPVAEEEKEQTEDADAEETKVEDKNEEAPKEVKDGENEEPEVKIQVEKPDQEAMEEGAVAVFEKEGQSTDEEEEKATDAEVITIEPDAKAKVEDSGLSFDFAFEREAAPEEPAKQKEITFEDYKDYKEPEFVKKDEVDAPKQKPKDTDEPAKEPEPETPQEPAVRDWRDWEPSKSAEATEAKTEEPVKEEPKEEGKEEPVQPIAEEPKQESSVKGNIATRADFERPKSLNDTLGKSISLGLNDRIAFEKHLFCGSADDLNRVLSQLNTINTFDEAKDFISELVKPDYNNWTGKEEYEERFMQIVEKKFN